MSFRTKLTLAFLLVSLVGAGLTGAALIIGSYQAQMEQIAEKELLLAQNRAHTLEDDLTLVQAELSRLSTLAEVDLADNDLEPEKRVLRYARKDSSLFQMRILLFDDRGSCLWLEPSDAAILGSSSAGEPWFERLRSTLRPVIVDAGQPNGLDLVRVAVPILRNEKFSGALVGLLPTMRQTRFEDVLHIDLAPSGSAAILDTSGNALFSLGNPAGLAAIRGSEAARLGLSGKLGREWRTEDGRTWLYAYAPISSAGWTMVIRQAKDELDDDLDHELRLFSVLLLLGVSLAVLAGWTLARLVTRPLVTLNERAQKIAEGDFGTMPLPFRRTDGDEIEALERAFYRMDQAISTRDREIRGLAATLEGKVEDRTAELRRTQNQLLVSNRFAAMGKTAAAIAHELKNALNGLGVAVDLLASGNAPPDKANAVRVQVREEVARLRDICDNLNLFAGEPRLHYSQTDVHEMIRRTLELLRPALLSAGVEVDLDLARDRDETPASFVIPCDAQKLQSTLINLCKNAVEAMAPGLDNERAAGRSVLTVRTRLFGDEASIEVQDTGAGFDSETGVRLFEPFFTTKRTGTGLGLAIARKVVEAHGGKLTARSHRGGATFKITLPAQVHLEVVSGKEAS